MSVSFFCFFFIPPEITRSAFFARRTRRRVCGSVDSINDPMCQQEYWRWLGSIDTCLRIHRHMHNAHLYNTRLDTTSSFRNSGLHLSQPSQPCAELSLHIFEASSSLIHKCWRYTLAIDMWCLHGWLDHFSSQINQWTKKFLRSSHKQCPYFYHWTEEILKLNFS